MLLMKIRKSGRTTGLMLQALAKAILNPGKTVEFDDHYPTKDYAKTASEFVRLKSIVTALNLENIKFKVHTDRIEIKSEFPGQIYNNLRGVYTKLYCVICSKELVLSEQCWCPNHGIQSKFHTDDEFDKIILLRDEWKLPLEKIYKLLELGR